MKNVFNKIFTVVLNSGKQVTAEIEAEFGYDANSGADADGNRGIGESTLDGLYFTVSPDNPEWGADDNGNELSKEEQLEAQELLIAKAESYDWDERFESRRETEYRNWDV